MDIKSFLELGNAEIRQSHVEKKASKKPSGVKDKAFLKKQQEEEKRKADEAKRKKIELLKLRVDANRERKSSSMDKCDKENLKLFDMTEEHGQAVQKHVSDFEVLKHTDFEKKIDRKARTSNEAAIAARLKLEQVKNKMKVVPVSSSERVAKNDTVEGKGENKSPKTNIQKTKKDPTLDSVKPQDKPLNTPAEKPTAWVSVKPKNKLVNILTEEKPKVNSKAPKNRGPPPMSYKELMIVAKKRQNDPNTLKVAAAQSKKRSIDDRPLTQEEKDRQARRSTKEYQDWLKYGERASTVQSKDSRTSNIVSCLPKSQSRTIEPAAKLNGASSATDKRTSDSKASKPPISQNNIVHGNAAQKRSSSHMDRKNDKIAQKRSSSQMDRSDDKMCQPKKKSRFSSLNDSRKLARKQRPVGCFNDYGSLSDEYDSEMDDFIADDDEEDNADYTNYSKHIKSIFGYDRRKYQNERDDDLRGMEVGYATIAREEARSQRLGRKEDMEDMRREAEELRRKRATAKKRN